MKFKENREKIEGRIYQFDLSIKTVQNESSKNYGTEFISGNLEVAVDEDILNVIPIHFTYVVEQTKNGKKNATYTALKKIIEEGKTIIADGKDEATKVRIDTALGLNEFYTQDDQLVSVKTNEGGFVTIINELGPVEERNTFATDIIITNVSRVEADEEKNIKEDYAIVKGAIFDFRGALLPIDFVVRNPQGLNYFEDLGASGSNPIYTKVWGKINCETITRVVEEESAFGEAAVRTYERKTKEWVITGSSRVPYEFGDEEVLTSEELTKLMQDRELMLADLKKRNDEYKAQKASQTTAAPKTQNVAKQGTFNF